MVDRFAPWTPTTKQAFWRFIKPSPSYSRIVTDMGGRARGREGGRRGWSLMCALFDD